MTDVCPKCSSTDGWRGPTYRNDSYTSFCGRVPQFVHRDWLVYACVRCGYERLELTHDAPPPEPPPNRKMGSWRWLFGLGEG